MKKKLGNLWALVGLASFFSSGVSAYEYSETFKTESISKNGLNCRRLIELQDHDILSKTDLAEQALLYKIIKKSASDPMEYCQTIFDFIEERED